jgi:hypothetical protein
MYESCAEVSWGKRPRGRTHQATASRRVGSSRRRSRHTGRRESEERRGLRRFGQGVRPGGGDDWRTACGTTDTTGMNAAIRIIVGSAVVALGFMLPGATRSGAGEPCGACRQHVGGPCAGCRQHGGGRDYGTTGCGPRYWGAVYEDPHCVDPCDSCGRWRGCNGARQLPDMLAPWQLPPGRGFLSGEQVGYAPGPCRSCGPGSSAGPCGTCGPCGNSLLAKHAAKPCRSIYADLRPDFSALRPDFTAWGHWVGSVWPW